MLAGGPGLAIPPTSCTCKNTDANCAANVYSDGCYDAMANLITSIQYAMAGIAIAVAAVEVRYSSSFDTSFLFLPSNT
jgi:hypothetical protein